MNRNCIRTISTYVALLVVAVPASSAGDPGARSPFRGALLSCSQVENGAHERIRDRDIDAVALLVTDVAESRRAARKIRAAGLALYYWIEIGRNAQLADEHPEWMGSIQGHPKWRRLFPDAPSPEPNEVVKCYPWTPILYQENFNYHLKRVRRLLSRLPKPDGVFLNDLQGVPSACGCGNALCRWTTDYGPVVTATRIGDDAAARFVSAVQERNRGIEVIPVWSPECETADPACAGVGCIDGACWDHFSRQFGPLQKVSETIGVLALYKTFQRTELATTEGQWAEETVRRFETMPRRYGAEGLPARRALLILEGWNGADDSVDEQIAAALRIESGGFLLALTPIDQSWAPRLYAQ